MSAAVAHLPNLNMIKFDLVEGTLWVYREDMSIDGFVPREHRVRHDTSPPDSLFALFHSLRERTDWAV
jgi:hypothetical protein